MNCMYQWLGMELAHVTPMTNSSTFFLIRMWLFSCPVLSFFFFFTCPARTVRPIFMLRLKWRSSAQGRSFFGLGWWVMIFFGQGGMCPQNCPKRSMNRRFQVKVTKYWNLHIIETTASIPTKFCTVIKTTKCPSWVVQTPTQQIQDGGRPPSWKNKNRHISDVVRPFRQILAWRRSLAILSTPTVKISKI